LNRKLTLKLDDALIAQAKGYARASGVSLSRLVQDYFRFLSLREPPEVAALSPTVRELSGVIRLPSGYDREARRADYARHLARKHR
jgi:hypothetical protein